LALIGDVPAALSLKISIFAQIAMSQIDPFYELTKSAESSQLRQFLCTLTVYVLNIMIH